MSTTDKSVALARAAGWDVSYDADEDVWPASPGARGYSVGPWIPANDLPLGSVYVWRNPQGVQAEGIWALDPDSGPFGEGMQAAALTLLPALPAGFEPEAQHVAAVVTAAQALLDAFGGDTPEWLEGEAAALQSALGSYWAKREQVTAGEVR